ncbi:Tubulin alpha-2 chain [Hibiscus syriacus]|uniref:Tubulin alpha-2 chain n=1 Tax=Hibiscus syriacus TaxID=106335 RepID=A0A6A3AUM0_HIBSY|nr:protein SHORT HYPOCOTYL IN WHITE LIGHT 1-like [Hibiscus syriacus]KAE8708410.1 Tubulin alpha-2 chain [Hibiscus syriacus]
MAFAVIVSPSHLTISPCSKQPSFLFRNPRFPSFQPLFASRRRTPNFTQVTYNLPDGPHNWSRSIATDFYDDQEVDDDEDDDRSLDLLVKFVQNVFRKISKRARKAVRSVLPVSIPSNLVGFSVNGVLILALLWVLKAFLEVVCTLGSVVFVSILLVRGIWTGVLYMQEIRERRISELVDDRRTWSGTLPAT